MTKITSFFKIFTFGLGFTSQAFPITFTAYTLAFIIQGAALGIIALATQHFFDSVNEAVTGTGTVENAVWMAAALAGVIIAKELINRFPALLRRQLYEKSIGRINQLLHMKMSRIDPICLEDTKYHDDIEKAKIGAESVLLIPNLLLALLAFYPVYFIVMGIYLHHLRPQFLLFLLLVFIPIICSQFIRTGIISKYQDKATPIRREYNYYIKTITGREYFKETRLLGGYGFFLNHLYGKLKELRKADLQTNAKTCILELAMGILSALGYVGILLLMANALLAGEITVGAFMAVFSSVSTMFLLMEQMVTNMIGGVASFIGTAHGFMRFLDLPERSAEDGRMDINGGVVAKNISFTYPYAEVKSIDNISLNISPGETVAIVGENGAGKTTLVRLLTGLYTPVQGVVYLNGMDTAKTNAKMLFNGTSGVFQRFIKYQMTLDENIRISQVDKDEDVHRALGQAGININSQSFPDRGDTMLSREFDGVDLSGGEWQRIAIARGLYRTHNFIVLDEPTAAIDPIEENRVYQQFTDISREKTAIIVTHRLGSTRIADRVLVMDKGRIIEVGTHDELVARGGHYAKMFSEQAAWYDE